MIASRTIGVAAVIVIALLAAPAAPRAEAPDSTRAPLPVALGPGSVLWIEGTSTVHAFESRSKEVGIALERDRATPEAGTAADLLRLIRSAAIRGVTVRVPVASLRSEKSGLDRNLRKAMNAEQYPNVTFHLGQYDVASAAVDRDTIEITAGGSLTIAGQERPIRLEARACAGEAGVWLEGSESLRMSEYGIKPPTMMLGTLRVGDQVTVRYRLLLVPKGGASSPSPDGK
ncbi:MAG TPA: YceI family protein [Candidatus Eisenbacteria bacterium]|jgi:hypothetical protein